jgi:hypothetical protein
MTGSKPFIVVAIWAFSVPLLRRRPTAASTCTGLCPLGRSLVDECDLLYCCAPGHALLCKSLI